MPTCRATSYSACAAQLNATRIAVSVPAGFPTAHPVHIHGCGRGTGECCLIGICGACLLVARHEQTTQSDIIGAQRLQLAGKPLLHDLHSA